MPISSHEAKTLQARQFELAKEFRALGLDVFEAEGRTRARGRIAAAQNYVQVRVRRNGTAVSHVFSSSGGASGHTGRVYDEHRDAHVAIDFSMRMVRGLESFNVLKNSLGSV
ncbi:MAG: hypothetical protein O9327_02445 [Polaromonas sp.]|nr:hypothetical protein [Polaromonas sp.]